MFQNCLAFIISVPISKSSAVDSYDILSKNETKQIEVNIGDLPIKYFKKYKICCLKDGSTEDISSVLEISVLNIFGLFTNTTIDYPDHWFLIATAQNWANDIDEIISYSKEIIEEKKNLENYHQIRPSRNRNIITGEGFGFLIFNWQLKHRKKLKI